MNNKKNTHDSLIIDPVKEELTCLVLPLTLDDHEEKGQLHLHRKIVADTDMAIKKQATKNQQMQHHNQQGHNHW